MLALVCLCACAELPDPQTSEDLASLARRYEAPSAKIPGELIERLVRESSDSSELEHLLDGLRLVHSAVAEAAARLAKEGDADELDLQGTVDVVHVCPGFDSEPTSELEQGGAIELRLSIEHSMVRRGIRGTAEGCRFLVGSGRDTTRVELDAKLAIDLGADTRIGASPPAQLLVRLRRVNADIDRTSPAALLLRREQYDFRVSDERVETLIDMAALGFAPLGSAVLIVHRDGTLGVRERRGEWRCDRAGEACELIR